MTPAPPTTGAPAIPGLVYVQPLGSGGYADVYLYEQQSPRMPVAVKVLRAQGMTDDLRTRFVEEADTMARLGDHPNIVQVFRTGTSDDGRPYLVMKYYPPPDLARRARAHPLSVEDVLRTGIQLASAIETAHRAGVVHRDVKPANVLVSSYGAPGLTDFGVAGAGQPTLVPPSGPRAPETSASTSGTGGTGGAEVGVSVPWAPPEVLYSESDGDERGDIYSLAATLWQLLVGRSPFEVRGGDNTAYALMPRIRTLPVPPTGRPDVPVTLERLLAQAMAKDPARRPGSALELAHALQGVEEQLRMPRTPVVVLDEGGHARLLGRPGEAGRPNPSGRRSGDGPPDPDATRVKGPVRVRAQLSAPDGPTAVAERPSAAAGQAPPSHATFVRRRLILVAVLVAVVAFAALALRPRSTPAPAPTRTPVATVTTTADSAIGDAVFAAPTVTATPGVGRVEFSWSYAGPRKSDTYRVHVGSTPAEAEVADPVTLTAAAYTVTVTSGSVACLVATVVRQGQISPAPAPVCATAR